MIKNLFQSLLLVLGLIAGSLRIQPFQAQTDSIEIYGLFTILQGDTNPHDKGDSQVIYQLFGEDGQRYQLSFESNVLDQKFNLQSLNQQHVRVEVVPSLYQLDSSNYSVYDVLSIDQDETSAMESLVQSTNSLVYGNQPWVSILCKFFDITEEPRDLYYFQDMYSNEYPGLNHYWREVSYNSIDINGSTAFGWFTLPQPRSYYYSASMQNLTMLERLVTDCTNAADPYVNFNKFIGVNMMFNGELDGYAYGGAWYLNLDGAYRLLNVTWEPIWGYSSITVITHEMGHGFGLPHSSGSYDQIYDNVWDVMSDPWSNCSFATDGVFGCLGQHTIAYHKDLLGWIPADRKYIVPYVGSGLPEPTVLPAYYPLLMAQIPIQGASDHFYTVELRRQNGYDAKLPGNAMIIHDVIPSRQNLRPANLVDVDMNGNTGDEGAMWGLGESFQDAANQISISVLSSSGENFQIHVTNGQQAATFWLMPTAKVHPFADVSMFHWSYESTVKLLLNHLTSGCGTNPLIFCPNDDLTRAQIALFLLKGMKGPSYTPPFVGEDSGFKDVAIDYWAAPWIKQLALENITDGCGDMNYCPDNPVTRAQMAVFLLKAKHGAFYVPPMVGIDTGFNDVPASHWASAWIKQLASEAITVGCRDGNYCPDETVTRAQMAVFLTNTFNLP